MQSINVQPLPKAPKNNKATPPNQKKVNLKFDYTPSSDGIDNNLLILLHGLGDSKGPFAKLGQQLKLPQTATLSVQAPESVPYMDDAYQWFPSFNMFTGELLTAKNPERLQGLIRTRNLLNDLVQHLIEGCGFKPSNIFFFGFSQGGTVALDLVLFSEKQKSLGGVISISGYLLEEHPVKDIKEGNAGHVLITQGEKDTTIHKLEAEEKFKQIKKLAAKAQQVFIANKDHTMPSSKEEWKCIHTFFADNMDRRNIELENMSDVYSVTTQ